MTRAAAAAVMLAAWVIGCGDDRDSGRREKGPQLGAVIKGLENPFFATMRDGLVETARRRDAGLHVSAAAGLQDTAGQAAKLSLLAARKADCYVVNPITPTNLIQALEHVARGTPIVNIDSPIDVRAAAAVDVSITTYIGTDNAAAGRLGADAMAGFVDRGAMVAAISGIPGDAGSRARIEGFREGARGRFDVVDTIAADFDRDRARLAAEDLLRREPGVQGVFAVNDEMALGIAEAVRAVGRRGEVAVVGVDGIRSALAAVSRGAMSATVAQYPYTIGQLGVEACLAATRGESLPAGINAPVQLVTADNAARAQARFPRPVESFRDPIAGLLDD